MDKADLDYIADQVAARMSRVLPEYLSKTAAAKQLGWASSDSMMRELRREQADVDYDRYTINLRQLIAYKYGKCRNPRRDLEKVAEESLKL